MHIGEEVLGVILDLLNIEAEAIVFASSRVVNASDKAIFASLDAANTAANALTARHLHGVGERDARRAGFAFDGFVDVRGGGGGRLVVALETGQGDVVADDVFFAVDAEFVQAFGALEAAGEGVVGVDDLVGSGVDFVGGGEGEGGLQGDWMGMSVGCCFDRCKVCFFVG